MRGKKVGKESYLRGFTLVELLAVVGILSMLGGVAVAAGFAVARDVSDRSAREMLVGFLRNAAEISSTENVRVVVHFRDHEIAATDDLDAEPVGRAFAVRATGRVSAIVDGHPWDEFADEGPVRLDDSPEVFPLAAVQTEWRVGAPYGTAFAALELPKGYWVEKGIVAFVPSTGSRSQMEGRVALLARRADGTTEPIGAEISAAEMEVAP